MAFRAREFYTPQQLIKMDEQAAKRVARRIRDATFRRTKALRGAPAARFEAMANDKRAKGLWDEPDAAWLASKKVTLLEFKFWRHVAEEKSLLGHLEIEMDDVYEKLDSRSD